MKSSLLDPKDAVLAVIDVQERHFPSVQNGPHVLDRICRMVELTRLMGVPRIWTEHYPKGFGPTLSQVADRLQDVQPISKRTFSCFGTPEFDEAVQRSGRSHLYLVGTETPICVLQTALHALERGMKAVVVADCVAGRLELDHEVAMQRMHAAGALLVSWEMLAYEWLQEANHPNFKAVLELVKRPLSGWAAGGGRSMPLPEP